MGDKKKSFQSFRDEISIYTLGKKSKEFTVLLYDHMDVSDSENESAKLLTEPERESWMSYGIRKKGFKYLIKAFTHNVPHEILIQMFYDWTIHKEHPDPHIWGRKVHFLSYMYSSWPMNVFTYKAGNKEERIIFDDYLIHMRNQLILRPEYIKQEHLDHLEELKRNGKIYHKDSIQTFIDKYNLNKPLPGDNLSSMVLRYWDFTQRHADQR